MRKCRDTADDLPKIKEVLAEQLVEPTVMKDMQVTDEELTDKTEENDETTALAVTEGGELVINEDAGEGEES